MNTIKYTPPKTHQMPQNRAEFMASLTVRDREIHEMALRDLGSSYFMERTNGYNAWKKAN
jgi:hypothetical protein